MADINFTDHYCYDNPVTTAEMCGNASEEFFNWSGRTIHVVKGVVNAEKSHSPNIPLVALKFLACLTVIIPLAFLIIRTYTRSVLLANVKAASLEGRVSRTPAPSATRGGVASPTVAAPGDDRATPQTVPVGGEGGAAPAEVTPPLPTPQFRGVPAAGGAGASIEDAPLPLDRESHLRAVLEDVIIEIMTSYQHNDNCWTLVEGLRPLLSSDVIRPRNVRTMMQRQKDVFAATPFAAVFAQILPFIESGSALAEPHKERGTLSQEKRTGIWNVLQGKKAEVDQALKASDRSTKGYAEYQTLGERLAALMGKLRGSGSYSNRRLKAELAFIYRPFQQAYPGMKELNNPVLTCLQKLEGVADFALTREQASVIQADVSMASSKMVVEYDEDFRIQEDMQSVSTALEKDKPSSQAIRQSLTVLQNSLETHVKYKASLFYINKALETMKVASAGSTFAGIGTSIPLTMTASTYAGASSKAPALPLPPLASSTSAAGGAGAVGIAASAVSGADHPLTDEAYETLQRAFEDMMIEIVTKHRDDLSCLKLLEYLSAAYRESKARPVKAWISVLKEKSLLADATPFRTTFANIKSFIEGNPAALASFKEYAKIPADTKKQIFSLLNDEKRVQEERIGSSVERSAQTVLLILNTKVLPGFMEAPDRVMRARLAGAYRDFKKAYPDMDETRNPLIRCMDLLEGTSIAEFSLNITDAKQIAAAIEKVIPKRTADITANTDLFNICTEMQSLVALLRSGSVTSSKVVIDNLITFKTRLALLGYSDIESALQRVVDFVRGRS